MFNKIKEWFNKPKGEVGVLTKEHMRKLNDESLQYRLIQMLCLDTSFVISGEYHNFKSRWCCSISVSYGVVSGGWHTKLSKAIVSVLQKYWDKLTIEQRKRILRVLSE